MAKERIVNTRFWSDTYISNLDPIEKLLFLYLITNQYTEISGLYELPLKYMAVDTGIDKEMIEKILKRFENDKKIKYVNGWVYVLNFSRYQKDNPKVKIGIKHAFSRVPKNILDSLSIDYDSLSHSNSNSNSNPNSNPNPEIEKPAAAEKDFIEILLELFCKSYEQNKGVEYIVSGKDKRQMGMLLSSIKKKFPEYDTEQMTNAMKVLFDKATAINDDNFLGEISISKLNSQINNYLQRIKNGTNQRNARNFAGDTDAKWERVLAKMG